MNRPVLNINKNLSTRIRTFSGKSPHPQLGKEAEKLVPLPTNSDMEHIALINLDEFHKGSNSGKNSMIKFVGDLDSIINFAIQVSRNGINHLLITSGKKIEIETGVVSYLIYSIKRHTDTKITLCLGGRNFPDLKNWQIAGADNYIYFLNAENEQSAAVNQDCMNQIECIRKSGLGLHIGFFIETELKKDGYFTEILSVIRQEKPDAVVPALPGGLNSSLTEHSENLFVRLRYFVLMLRTYFKELEIYYCNYWNDANPTVLSEFKILGATKIITRYR